MTLNFHVPLGGGTFKVCKGFKVFHTFFWKGWGCKGKSLLKFFAYSKINSVLLKIFLSEYCHAIKNKLIYNRLCHGTGRKINILRTYLWKISLTYFMSLVFFYTLWNASESRRFPDVFRGHLKRPMPWNGLRAIYYSGTYFVAYINNWR